LTNKAESPIADRQKGNFSSPHHSVPIWSELHDISYQARDGSLHVVGRDITFSDGKPIFFGDSQSLEEEK
jgi:hypothetical protein